MFLQWCSCWSDYCNVNSLGIYCFSNVVYLSPTEIPRFDRFVFFSKGTFPIFDRLELHDQLLDAHRRLRILSQSPSHRQTSSRKAAIIDGLNIFVNNFFSFFLKLDSNPGQLPLDVIEYKVRTNTLLFFRFQSIEEEFSCSLEHFHFVNLNYRIVMDMRIVLIGSIVFLRHFDQ